MVAVPKVVVSTAVVSTAVPVVGLPGAEVVGVVSSTKDDESAVASAVVVGPAIDVDTRSLDSIEPDADSVSGSVML